MCACAHNTPDPRRYRARQSFWDEFVYVSTDYRVNDQHRYTEDFEVFDSSKNVSVNTGELQLDALCILWNLFVSWNVFKLCLCFSWDILYKFNFQIN